MGTQTNFVKDYQPDTDASVELINGKIVDVIRGSFYDPGVRLVIKDGKILAMPGLKGTDSGISPDFTIDLQGKTVLPGLFNVHCHVQMINPTVFADRKTIKARKQFRDQQVDKNMADCLARGVTNIRDAFADDLTGNQQLTERISKGEIPGPRIKQAVAVGARGGYLMPELRGIKKLLLGVLGLGSIDYEDQKSGAVVFSLDAGEQEVRDAVDRAIDERGADLIKVGESLEESILNSTPFAMSMAQIQAITDQARKRGVPSTIHSVSVDTFRRALEAGFTSLAHMARDGALTQDDVDLCLKSGSFIEPTLSVGYDMSWKLPGDPYFDDANLETLYKFRNSTYTDLAKEFWLPELADCVAAGFNKASQGKYKMLGLFNLSKLLVHFSRLAHFGIENTKLLLEQGVPMACGNDGGVQACTPAMIGHELKIFDLFMNDSQKRFDGKTAVQTATINSARSMGIEEAFGSIEIGKVADLAIVNGDPFQEPGLIGSPVDALFMNGRLVIDNCGLNLSSQGV